MLGEGVIELFRKPWKLILYLANGIGGEIRQRFQGIEESDVGKASAKKRR